MNTFKQIQFKDKVALVRVDFNVPLEKDDSVRDTTRIDQTIPTIKAIIDQGGVVVLIAHRGRPEGIVDETLSLAPLISHIEKQLEKEVLFVEEKDEELLGAAIETAKIDGSIVLFENIRFFPEEEANNQDFAKFFGQMADVYVNEAFSASHRCHASIVSFPKYIKEQCIGLQFAAEIDAGTSLMKKSAHPCTLILGGAKIDTKAPLISRFIGSYDNFLIGGALANTFLSAQGFEIGDSLAEKKQIKLAQETMLAIEAHREKLLLPVDVIVVDEISEEAPRMDMPVENVEEGMHIMDIGLKTVEAYAKVIRESKTILWNGPMGYTEMEKFSAGTRHIAEAIGANKGLVSLVGGGDTVDSLRRLGIDFKNFSFVSTSGGAMIEYLEKGGHLPGIDALK